MENNNNINTVTVSISDYNLLKSNLEDTKDLLRKTQAELQTKKDNKILIVQKNGYDGYGYTKTDKLSFDISDPDVSEKILEIISKIDNEELKNVITDKTKRIDELKADLQDANSSNDRLARSISELKLNHKKDIEKVVKLYEFETSTLRFDQNKELRSQKEKYQKIEKDLNDLKEDKLQAQIELARELEISDLKDQIKVLNSYKDEIESISGNPFKVSKFVKRVRIAAKMLANNKWLDKLYTNTNNAVQRVESFKKMLDSISSKNTTPDPSPTYGWTKPAGIYW